MHFLIFKAFAVFHLVTSIPGIQTSHWLNLAPTSAPEEPTLRFVHTTQDIAAGRSACFSTEGLRGSLRTSHHHTCQLVTADRKVSSTLQISAGAAATEEGGARQVVASQLQADILTYRQSPRCSRHLCWHVCVPTSPTQELQQAAVGLQARTFDRDGAARCP